MKGLKLIPYTAVDGIATIRDSEILAIFERMQKDGTAEVVFYDGFIWNASSFLRFVKHNVDLFLIAELNNKIVGAAWFQEIASGVAQGHFCVFSSLWGLSEGIEVGREVIQFVLRYFNLIVGFIPVFNKRALDYMLRIGAAEGGIFPSFAQMKGATPVSATAVYFKRG